MEASKFVAFCPYRDKANQRIDDYLNERQELENDKELSESFDKLATPGVAPEDTTAKPTGHLYRGNLSLGMSFVVVGQSRHGWRRTCCGPQERS